MKVFVYWNLTKSVWSVKALQGPKRGLIIAHATHVVLENCEFRVSEKQRQFVIKNKRKVVHAGVAGYLKDNEDLPISESIKVTYNPYKYNSFVNKENTEQAIFKANVVDMKSDRSVTAYV
jgi:hypothetical protein